jgi:hypothetical protein
LAPARNRQFVIGSPPEKSTVGTAYLSNIDTVFDLNQIAGPDLALNCLTPFADFLPSFWAEGILRALDYLFSSARFSFPARVRSLAADGGRWLDIHQHMGQRSALW